MIRWKHIVGAFACCVGAVIVCRMAGATMEEAEWFGAGSFLFFAAAGAGAVFVHTEVGR